MLRSGPAPAALDQKFLREQRELLVKAYKAVRMLRVIFESNPQVRPHAKISQRKVRDVLIY
jgi:RNase P/RNase MRP subunit p30